MFTTDKSTKFDKSYYYNDIDSFIKENPNTILGILVKNSFDTTKDQMDAWIYEINLLQSILPTLKFKGHIIFEYDIVRLGKRIDVVLLINNIVYSLEFKINANSYKTKDKVQAEDYALDLKNFHKESFDLVVAPILVATDAPVEELIIESNPDKTLKLLLTNKDTLSKSIQDIYNLYNNNYVTFFDKWYNSKYYPTRSIIEATIEAYLNNNIDSVNKYKGSLHIINALDELKGIIYDTKESNSKSIVFLSGVSGSGKTFLGINLVIDIMDHCVDDKSIFLASNNNLVKVLKAAINKNLNTKDTKFMQSIIQNYNFYKIESDDTILENVVVIDDFHDLLLNPNNVTKLERFIDIINKTNKWITFICLTNYNHNLDTNVLSSLLSKLDKNVKMYLPLEFNKNINKDLLINKEYVDSLFLKTIFRTEKSIQVSKFIDCVLDNKPKEACEIYYKLKQNYSIFLCRDLDIAKSCLKSFIRGSERYGLLSTKTAKRLNSTGFSSSTSINIVKWMLEEADDIRSSNALDIAANEYDIRGLDLDYGIVGWDLDLRRRKDRKGWDYYSFSGSSWKKMRQETRINNLINAYRTILKRCKNGMIIYIPEGEYNSQDPTRSKALYDEIYYYLSLECGILDLN